MSDDPIYDPASWYERSDGLVAAATTLWPKVLAMLSLREGDLLFPNQLKDFAQHGPPFLLLAAFAVENALKGTKVKQILSRGGEPAFSKAKKNDPNRVWDHELVELAKDVGLVMDQQDEAMLHVLTRNIQWAGRYPGTEASRPEAWFVPRYGSDDLARISSLVERIKRL